MQYRTMPKNGDRLSALGYGCMRLPVTKQGEVDEAKAIKQIRSAIDQGVNYLDTAWPYHAGQSEIVVGHALMDGYREKVNIATKLPSWMITTREEMDTFLNAQLRKLGVNQIDYYLLHALDGNSWDKLDSLGVREFLDTAVADNRIKNPGFSFHGRLEDFKRIVDAYPWTFCQIQYNFLDTLYQAGREGLEYAAENNLGVIVMEPLRGGNLGLPTPPSAVGEVWNRAEKHRTPAEWALGWVWNHKEVSVVLSGMNEDAHIQENLSIANTVFPGSFTKAEYRLVDEAAAVYKRLMKVDCTGCGYCMPCPEGVMIPAAFELYNKMHLFGNRQEALFLYAVRLSGMLTGSEPGYASQCVECRECVEKCPQEIEIPEMLASVAEELEDEHMKERLATAKDMLAMEKRPLQP